MSITTFIIFLLLNINFLSAQESIINFISDIFINDDATMRVQETIEVISKHKQIIHGIVREFPTKYKDFWENNYIVGFKVVSVTHNGHPEKYWIEPAENGKKIYIGKREETLEQGKHVYSITYETNRQLGFFEKYDELYWNVTGNGWRLPINFAQARVHLPSSIPIESIEQEAYTGFDGEQGKGYRSSIENNTIIFSTTKGLKPYEGLTIVVTFPKKFITQPSWHKEWYWHLSDNTHLIILMLQFIFLLVLLSWGIRIVSGYNKPGIIIPRFFPPAGLSPSECGFMKERKFQDRFLPAAIVDLAVHGFITISYKKDSFYSENYTLSLNDRSKISSQDISQLHNQLLSVLFSNGDTLIVTNTNTDQQIIKKALDITKKFCTLHKNDFISELTSIIGFAVVGGAISILALFWFEPEHGFFSTVGIIIFALFLIAMKAFFPFYTPRGRKLQDEIDGFELYLKTAEIERMKIIGTPPIKTPELYEKYLPYAMALNIEEEWTSQFSAVFEQLAQQKQPYRPKWYSGNYCILLNKSWGRSFSRTIVSSASTIAASGIVPGSSSGARGAGKSGGGSGGGGGGGW